MDPDQLCIMTYNILRADPNPYAHAWQDRRPLLTGLINSYSPDVIGTQEGNYRQIKEILNDCPQYDWIGLSRNGGSGGTRSEFMAIFYLPKRLEPLEYHHFWLSDTPETMGSKTWGNGYPRMVTWVRFLDRKTNREFYFFNTHFDDGRSEAAVKSARLVIERIKKLQSDFPIIFVGDLNSLKNSEVYRILVGSGFFSDTWEVAAELEGEDFDTHTNGCKNVEHRNKEHIDWIFSRGDITVHKSQIIGTSKEGPYPSDHYPVIARLSLDKYSGPYFQICETGGNGASLNSMGMFLRIWRFDGGIPGSDVRRTRDAELICFPEQNFAKVAGAPPQSKNLDISKLLVETIKDEIDMGEGYAIEWEKKVPTLREVFWEMQIRPSRLFYLNLLDVEYHILKALIREYGVEKQLIFWGKNHDQCLELDSLFPKAKTMLRLAGSPGEIQRQLDNLEESKFKGIHIIQVPLNINKQSTEKTFSVDTNFLKDALDTLNKYGVCLQVHAVGLNDSSIRRLRDIGINWYLTDSSAMFSLLV